MSGRVWVWVIVAVVVLAGIAIGADRRAARREIDSLVSAVDRYAADSGRHALKQDSLDQVRHRADSLSATLRELARLTLAAADARGVAAAAEADRAVASPTDSGRAGHWEAAYLVRTMEADSLRRAVALYREAAVEDSIRVTAAVRALVDVRVRLARADSLIIDLRVAVEQLRPRWYDAATLSVGCATTRDGWCRPGAMIGVKVADLGDVARRLPRWLR